MMARCGKHPGRSSNRAAQFYAGCSAIWFGSATYTQVYDYATFVHRGWTRVKTRRISLVAAVLLQTDPQLVSRKNPSITGSSQGPDSGREPRPAPVFRRR